MFHAHVSSDCGPELGGLRFGVSPGVWVFPRYWAATVATNLGQQEDWTSIINLSQFIWSLLAVKWSKCPSPHKGSQRHWKTPSELTPSLLCTISLVHTCPYRPNKSRKTRPCEVYLSSKTCPSRCSRTSCMLFVTEKYYVPKWTVQ